VNVVNFGSRGYYFDATGKLVGVAIYADSGPLIDCAADGIASNVWGATCAPDTNGASRNACAGAGGVGGNTGGG
jgi:hypothetical protein